MTAVVLLGHGSRAVGAGRGIERSAALLARRNPDCLVRVAHLEPSIPDLATVISALEDYGVKRIVVLPYFLHEGHHLQFDIPRELDRIRKEVPKVEVILGEHLGYDERIVELLEQRLTNAIENHQKSLAS